MKVHKYIFVCVCVCMFTMCIYFYSKMYVGRAGKNIEVHILIYSIYFFVFSLYVNHQGVSGNLESAACFVY